MLIWSSAKSDSPWVNREYQVLERLATGKPGFQFVPVRLDSSRLPVFGSNRIFLDFSSYPDGPNGGELLRLLHGVAGQPLSREAAQFALDLDEAAQQVGDQVNAAINRDSDLLIELFQKGGLAWQTSSALACKAAEGLIRLKHNNEAITMLDQIEHQFARAIRPRQLHALALARRGTGDDLRQAPRILGTLYQDGERDPETLGIYGRTWTLQQVQRHIGPAAVARLVDLYEEAFDRAPDDALIAKFKGQNIGVSRSGRDHRN